MSLASNSPHPPLPHTPPLPFRSFPPPPLPRLKAGRCPAGPQIRSSGFLHPDRSLLLASFPRWLSPRLPPSRARSFQVGVPTIRPSPARRWGTPSRPLSRARLGRARTEGAAGRSSRQWPGAPPARRAPPNPPHAEANSPEPSASSLFPRS